MVDQVKKFAFDEERSKVDPDKDIFFFLYMKPHLFFLKEKKKKMRANFQPKPRKLKPC